MDRSLDRLVKYILFATIFLVPLVISSAFPNIFVTSKLLVLVLGVSLALIVFAISVMVKGKLDFSVSRIDVAVLVIAIAYVAAGLRQTPNRMEALFLPGTASVVGLSALFYFLLNQLKSKEKHASALVLYISATIVSVVSLLVFAGVFNKVPQFPEYMKNELFTTVGGILPVVILLVAVLPMGIGFILSEKDATKKIFLIVSTTVVALGLLVSIFKILPGKPLSPQLPGFSTSWAISIDSLKVSPLLGSGSGNYLTAFNRFRPIEYNATDLWAVKFSTATNYFSTLITETGLLGTAGLIFLLISVYRLLQSRFKREKGFSELASTQSLAKNGVVISLVLLLVLMALFPSSLVSIFLLFVLLSLAAKTKEMSVNLSAQTATEPTQGLSTETVTSRIPAIFIMIPIIILVIVFGFSGAKAVRAEMTFKKSLDALSANDGKATFDLMRQAIIQNPRVDRYRMSMSQVNMLLANSIASKEEVTEEDRTAIAQLIQAAIEEGKAGVALNPPRSGNWELLADTYRAIVPLAEGSDAFAIQSYNQAIALDPINPNLRIKLGGVFFALGDYESAIEAFRTSVLAKPDLANAHFNLAVAYKEVGEMEKAVEQMTITLSLVEQGTVDYDLAKEQLEALEESQQLQAAAGEGENLTPPEETEPVLEPPLELPEEASPPAEVANPEEADEILEEQETPSPSPESSPEPTPTPEP